MSLHVQPFVAINQSAEQLNAVLKPLFEDLDRIGLKNYSSTTREYDTFFDLYIDLFEDESAGGSGLAGGWVFAHDDITQNNERIVNAFYNILSNSGYITGHFWYPGYGVPTPRTSTNPRFRNASDFVVFAIPVPTNATLDERSSAQYFLTENLDKTLRAAGPNGCGYVNEVSQTLPIVQKTTSKHCIGTTLITSAPPPPQLETLPPRRETANRWLTVWPACKGRPAPA